MSERDFFPLSVSCVRALNDKLYEKRKNGALEIERVVKEFTISNQSDQIKRMVTVLGNEFALSMNPNSKKGGLIGLAAVAIALGQDSFTYINELVRPVLACFHDMDCRVQYYACESLYNIAKVSRGTVLPFFTEIFDGLGKLSAHPDQNVRNGAELLDRLMKETVTESVSFDFMTFAPLIRERIYTKNTFARQFAVSWIEVLDTVPGINMIVLLPEILDGLFIILGEECREVRRMCQNVLSDFLQTIKRSNGAGVKYGAMANVLVVHSQNADDLTQYTAFSWLQEFVQLSGRSMLPHMAAMLTAVLPCLFCKEDVQRKVRDAAESLNVCLMKLVEEQDDPPSPVSDLSGDPSLEEPFNLCSGSSANDVPDAVQLEILPVIQVLKRHLLHDSIQTKIAVLKWFHLLFVKTPRKTFRYICMFFDLLMNTLSDPSDDVVLLDLEVLSAISSNPACPSSDSLDELVEGGSLVLPSPKLYHTVQFQPGLNQYFTHLMLQLTLLFKNNRHLLEDRGSFIIRQLSVFLSAKAIFSSLAEILLDEENLEFACIMVRRLNIILLTSTELHELRSQLKYLQSKECCSLFCSLYRCWSHSPVATISLCYLSQNYTHACLLLQTFADLEVTVDFLKEIDKLVQLIESPIFAYLRLQLLDPQRNSDLVKSLYGLLMLLPQSEAFKLLRHRLDCIPHFNFNSTQCVINTQNQVKDDGQPFASDINFQELLEHFLSLQSRHLKEKCKQIGRSLSHHHRS